jgi:hypothetical protein
MRYLCCDQISIFVESPIIQVAIADSLGQKVKVTKSSDEVADAVLFPFSLEESLQPAGERTVVAAYYNALSYKSLLYPKSIRGTDSKKIARLKSGYHLSAVAGLYSPRFILWLTLAKIAEHWDSALYFRLEDRAMRQLIETGLLRRLSYIVVVTGRSTS